MNTLKAIFNLFMIVFLFVFMLVCHIWPMAFHGILSLFGGGETKRKRRLQFLRAAISWDQAVNTSYWGHPDNTISGRVGWWASEAKCPVALKMEPIINWFMSLVFGEGPDHCRRSIEKDEPQCSMPFFEDTRVGGMLL